MNINVRLGPKEELTPGGVMTKIRGRAAFCSTCGNEMWLEIQEAATEREPVSLSWYCPICKRDAQLSVAMGMLY